MTPDELAAANEHQVITFFTSWRPEWRLVKLIGLRRLLRERSAWRDDASEDVMIGDLDDSYVYGAMTSGLLAGAVSEVVMSCEDLLALLRALREEHHFARRIINYDAGRIRRTADVLGGFAEDQVAAVFLVPPMSSVDAGFNHPDAPQRDTAAARQRVVDARQRLREMVASVCHWYGRYEFFHNRYKHGLSLALQPFGGALPPTTVASRRASLSGSVIAYDNDPITDKLVRGQLKWASLTVPNMAPAISPHLKALANDRNLLRYVLGRDMDLGALIETARDVLDLSLIARANRLAFANRTEEDGHTFELPAADRGPRLHITVSPSSLTPELGDYRTPKL